MQNPYNLAADALLIVHFAFVAFVVGGEVLVIAGGFLKWQWVRDLRFRICHLLSIGFVTAQAWAGRFCPLTLWENALRHAAGEAAYTDTFIEHWVAQALYHDFPPWAFTLAYTLFGTLVVFSWIWVRPRRRRSPEPPKVDA